MATEEKKDKIKSAKSTSSWTEPDGDDGVLVGKGKKPAKKKYKVVKVIDPTTIRVLLDNGTNWKVRNYKGKTPKVGEFVEL